MAAALLARVVGLAWIVLFGIEFLLVEPVTSATVTGNSLLGNPGVPRDALAARTAGAGSSAAGTAAALTLLSNKELPNKELPNKELPNKERAAALPLLLLCVASCKHLVSSSCASPASKQLHTPASPATGQGHNGQ